MMACSMESITCVNDFGEIPVDKYSPLNLRFRLVVMIRVRGTQVVRADDQYIPGANVLMKNTGVVSGFMSYNESG